MFENVSYPAVSFRAGRYNLANFAHYIRPLLGRLCHRTVTENIRGFGRAAHSFNHLRQPFDGFTSHHVLIHEPENRLRHLRVRGQQDYWLVGISLLDVVRDCLRVQTFRFVIDQHSSNGVVFQNLEGIRYGCGDLDRITRRTIYSRQLLTGRSPTRTRLSSREFAAKRLLSSRQLFWDEFSAVFLDPAEATVWLNPRRVTYCFRTTCGPESPQF